MIWSRPNSSSRWHIDRIVGAPLGAIAAGVASILMLVLAFLGGEALPALLGIGWLRLLTDDGWHPLEGQFGLSPMLVATLASTAGAVALAAPLGIGSAVFLRFYAPRPLARAYRTALGLLAGIPSVVYGLWGLTVLVPLIARWTPPGASLLTAILILALMIVPTVALTSASALASVPEQLLLGGHALGMRRKGIVLGIALPGARAGIASGIVLASARALGETMAVLMVAGNVAQVPASLFAPVRTLTGNIALEMAYAGGLQRSALFATGLVLTAMVIALAWLGAPGARAG
ncbi:phosphate ABC transporter permease subunit PstC [Duganella sp. FT3S]|uniref:Phosphate transport system permease protein n=1 Tax=Rugamonas fusca TaxID=2758568 RepID=A0A7W2EDZ8_9BURK|nr:phosphate ABC transporter permease subunit PstC [Rugamonas fusca]MBA5604192.1 phosphate ABC transporter permease subunit PstC [Rugamonas fusca]